MTYKSDIHTPPGYFDRYIQQVPQEELFAAFEASFLELEKLRTDFWRTKQTYAYAPGKWTVNQVLQHVLDWERILGYRTLLIARGFSQAQPALDENTMAGAGDAGHRSLDGILDEMGTVRTTSHSLFKSLKPEEFSRVGTNWHDEMSVLALGFNLLGHQVHHLKILHERYV